SRRSRSRVVHRFAIIPVSRVTVCAIDTDFAEKPAPYCELARHPVTLPRSNFPYLRFHRQRRARRHLRSGTNSVHDENCNRAEAGIGANVVRYTDDRIQQGLPSTPKCGRRAGGFMTGVEDHLAIGQPSIKSGNQAGSPASVGAPLPSATGRCSVQPWETRQVRLLKRAARRADLGSVEQLESRALLAFSPLGFSLPDLIVTGQAGPRAAWGGVLDVAP